MYALIFPQLIGTIPFRFASNFSFLVLMLLLASAKPSRLTEEEGGIKERMERK